jgi:hypothetical protein
MNLTEVSLRNPAGVLVAILGWSRGHGSVVRTPGDVMPLGDLVRMDSAVGAGGVRRVHGHRTIGLDVSPPRELSLGQVVKIQLL